MAVAPAGNLKGQGRTGPADALLAPARQLAARLPDLRLEARRIAMTINSGWHGRRQAGMGETFWQFRAYAPGEPASRIDWRRSARGRQLYVRESEWEAAHTLRLAVDLSPSMDFASTPALASKRERALVLAFAIADLALESGERVGVLGAGKARIGRVTLDHLAETFLRLDGEGLPERFDARRFDDVIIISDFLDDPARTNTLYDRLAGLGVRVHALHVIDPAEESFPYEGRVAFRDPESAREVMAGRAQGWKDDYARLFAAFKDAEAQRARARGFTHLVHHTDQPASLAAISLSRALSLPPDQHA